MKLHSTEHKILRLLYKLNQDRVAAKEQFMTDGVLDVDKIEVVLEAKGISLPEARAAFQALVLAGYITAKGVVKAAGITKLDATHTAFHADIDALGLRTLITTGFGDPDPTAVETLATKEY